MHCRHYNTIWIRLFYALQSGELRHCVSLSYVQYVRKHTHFRTIIVCTTCGAPGPSSMLMLRILRKLLKIVRARFIITISNDNKQIIMCNFIHSNNNNNNVYFYEINFRRQYDSPRNFECETLTNLHHWSIITIEHLFFFLKICQTMASFKFPCESSTLSTFKMHSFRLFESCRIQTRRLPRARPHRRPRCPGIDSSSEKYTLWVCVRPCDYMCVCVCVCLLGCVCVTETSYQEWCFLARPP